MMVLVHLESISRLQDEKERTRSKLDLGMGFTVPSFLAEFHRQQPG